MEEIRLLKDVADAEQSPFDEAYSLGFKVFDDSLLGGVRGGDLVVISGISGHGKTSFAQTLTYNFSTQAIPCLWFSYEVNNSHLQRKFDNMTGTTQILPIYSPSRITSGRVDWVADMIKEGVAKYQTKMVFIDHLDFLMPSTVKSTENESAYLRRIVMELKSVAIRENVTIFLMAHVKKVSEEPEMADIANSASIFQNADVVFIVYRIAKERSKLFDYSGDLFTNQTKVKMVKNRVTGQSKFMVLEMEQDHFMEVADINSL